MEFERNLKTKNGVDVYYYKNPSLHGFYISLFVKAGVIYEKERYYGITHFFEHAAIRNVNKLYGMKLYETIDRYGIDFNASTYSEMVNFFVSGASKNFTRGIPVIASLLDPLGLSRQEIDAERRRIMMIARSIIPRVPPPRTSRSIVGITESMPPSGS